MTVVPTPLMNGLSVSRSVATLKPSALTPDGIRRHFACGSAGDVAFPPSTFANWTANLAPDPRPLQLCSQSDGG